MKLVSLTVGFVFASLVMGTAAHAFTLTDNALGNSDAKANLSDPDEAFDQKSAGVKGFSFGLTGSANAASGQDSFASHDASENPLAPSHHFSSAPGMPWPLSGMNR